MGEAVADTIVESFELLAGNCSDPEGLAESFLASIEAHIEVTQAEWTQIASAVGEVVRRKIEERAPIGAHLDCLA